MKKEKEDDILSMEEQIKNGEKQEFERKYYSNIKKIKLFFRINKQSKYQI